jgi:hypothetical protein
MIDNSFAVQNINKNYILRVLIIMISATFALSAWDAFAEQPQSAQRLFDLHDGVRVPVPGDQGNITRLLRNTDGHMVVELIFKRGKNYRVNFYDVATGRTLADDQELNMAKSNQALFSFIARAHLKEMIGTATQLKLDRDYRIEQGDWDGRLCHWPYNVYSEVKRGGQIMDIPRSEGMMFGGATISQIMIFIRLARPETRAYERDCEDTVGTYKLTTHYTVPGSEFYADGSGGFYLVPGESLYVIHFNKFGKTTFFSRRSDIVNVPPDKIEKILGKANEGEAHRSQQSFVAEAEALVNQTAELQMRVK